MKIKYSYTSILIYIIISKIGIIKV